MLGSVKRHILFHGVAAAALAACGGAFAEAATAPGAGQAAGGVALQEVIVTAQKRSERLVDVPMAINVVSAQSAEARGIHDIQDLSQAVAGVEITFGGYAVQPAIRGVTSSDPLLENNVVVYIDGFYQPDQNTINAQFPNLQDIQILKGPQGALYGRNATGGAILYTTAPPSRTFTGALEGSYGNFNTWSLNGFISGPISDRLRFSIAGEALNSDGYYRLVDPTSGALINNKAAPIRSYVLRTKLQADVTDNLTVTLGYNYTELTDARGDTYTPETYNGVANPPGLLYKPYTDTFPGTQQFDAQHDAQLTIVWRTPIGTLHSYTGQSYRTEKDDFQYGYPTDIYEKIYDRNFQENVDFDFTAVKNLDLTVGGTYFRDVNNTKNSDVIIPPLGVIDPVDFPGGFYEDQHVELFTAAYALFAQGAYHLFNDRLTLSAGIRYSEEEKSETFSVTGPTGAYTTGPFNAVNNHANFPNFSPQGSIRYKFAEGSEAYASITDGFRSGQVQINAITPTQALFEPVKPEKITSYEVGYKLERRTVQFTTAFFYYNYTNLQQSVTIPSCGQHSSTGACDGPPISLVQNAPKATIYGLEGEVKWAPVRHLNLDVTGAWLHARFGNYAPNPVTGVGGPSGIGVDAATGLNVSELQNWSGQPLFRSPDFSATFAASYEFQDVFGGSLLASGNVKATTKYLLDNGSLYCPAAPTNGIVFGPPCPAGLGNTQRFVQPAYALANLSLTWVDPSRRYHITGYVDNVANTMYRLDWDGAAYGNYNTWAWPRTYGLRVGVKF